MRTPILDRIREPADLKVLNNTQLATLASEIREMIVDVVTKNGGHLASNLGVVELTLALHRVFESPKDKIIWDVGHQCYTHKLITGRNDRFATIRKRDGLSGFPKRSESEHDIFETGHSSTSISAALGLLVATEMKRDALPRDSEARTAEPDEGRIVVVIGDGSISGGMAFEALNHAGHLRRNLIIILNDNQMSIGPNVGALSLYLSRITATSLYQNFRRRIDTGVQKIPVFGRRLMDIIIRGKKSIKAFFYRETIFSDLGFEYIGPIDGHNLPLLERILSTVKRLEKPVVVHVCTRKGKGYELAELDPAGYHGVSPLSLYDGKLEEKSSVTYSDVFSRWMIDRGDADESAVAITAAMAKGTGLAPFRSRYPDRFFDVGICEQHALTFAAGLAAGGARPVVAVYSTFLQRAVDQLIHDIALPEYPVLLVVDRAGVVAGDGETHQGIYDIALTRGLPGLTILAPGSRGDMVRMLDYACTLPTPVMVRFPKADAPEIPELDVPVETGRGVFLRRFDRRRPGILLIAVGAMCAEALIAEAKLREQGINVDVYALRSVKPIDSSHLAQIASGYDHVVVVEEGIVAGGAGEAVRGALQSAGCEIRVETIGVGGMFNARGNRRELLAGCRIDSMGIAERLRESLGVEESL